MSHNFLNKINPTDKNTEKPTRVKKTSSAKEPMHTRHTAAPTKKSEEWLTPQHHFNIHSMCIIQTISIYFSF